MPETKPPLPTRLYDPFPRITVDEAEGSAFAVALRLAVSAADRWTLGPEGPYQKPGQTGADVTCGHVREALLHLIELGFVDIDEERLRAAKGWPSDRQSLRDSSGGDSRG